LQNLFKLRHCNDFNLLDLANAIFELSIAQSTFDA
jgi:hypothetical protein